MKKTQDQRLSFVCHVTPQLTFLGVLAKQGASNSLILLEGEDADQQGKTSAFFLRA